MFGCSVAALEPFTIITLVIYQRTAEVNVELRGRDSSLQIHSQEEFFMLSPSLTVLSVQFPQPHNLKVSQIPTIPPKSNQSLNLSLLSPKYFSYLGRDS